MTVKEIFENRIKELFCNNGLDIIVHSKSSFLQIEFNRKLSDCYISFKECKVGEGISCSISSFRGKYRIKLEDDITEYLEYHNRIISFLSNKKNIKTIHDLFISYSTELKSIDKKIMSYEKIEILGSSV